MGGSGLACVDPSTGKIRWQVNGAGGYQVGGPYVSVSGNYALIDAFRDKESVIACFALGEEKAEFRWTAPTGYDGQRPSPVSKGRVFSSSGPLCVDLATGKPLSDLQIGGNCPGCWVAGTRLFASSDGKDGIYCSDLRQPDLLHARP
jgi:outer membrane protein assembly factor BamB